MATALELVEREDIGALTLREVARRAGVTHGAPYHHFPSKAALVAALAEEGYRVLYTAHLAAAAKAGADPITRLQALGVAYVHFALEHAGYFRVMFRVDVAEWSKYPAVLEAAQLTTVLLTSTVDEVIRRRELEINVMELALAAWSVVHGLATLWVDGPLRHSQSFAANQTIGQLAERITAVSTAALSAGSTASAPKARRRS
jgi:AcrR family transcriptional regulator